jgi:hypothetical protein
MLNIIIIILLLPISYVAVCTILATDGAVLLSKIKKRLGRDE